MRMRNQTFVIFVSISVVQSVKLFQEIEHICFTLLIFTCFVLSIVRRATTFHVLMFKIHIPYTQISLMVFITG